METQERKEKRNKGGRPKKVDKRDQQLAVMCTAGERKIIADKAKQAGLSISEYLRDLGIKSQVIARARALPQEVLKLMGALNHMAANVNQIAKWANYKLILKEQQQSALEFIVKDLHWLAQELTERLK